MIAGSPASDGELLAVQLERLERRLAEAGRERERLLDAYQAGLVDLDQLTRRTKEIVARREESTREQGALRERQTELSRQNRLREGIVGFAERVAASLEGLDFEARRQLLRLVVEEVRVSGWRVEIHLRIPLEDGPGDDGRERRAPGPGPDPSSDMRLRSVGGDDLGMVDQGLVLADTQLAGDP